MRKYRKKFDNPNQMNLFDEVVRNHVRQDSEHPGCSLDIDTRFRAAVSDAIKNCPLSRYDIAARMSELTGHDITKSMIDNWSAESKKPWRMPAIYLAAFYKVTKSIWIWQLLTQPVGLYVMESPGALRAEITTLDEQIKKLQRGKKERQAFLKMVER